jgi:hypothetical protein
LYEIIAGDETNANRFPIIEFPFGTEIPAHSTEILLDKMAKKYKAKLKLFTDLSNYQDPVPLQYFSLRDPWKIYFNQDSWSVKQRNYFPNEYYLFGQRSRSPRISLPTKSPVKGLMVYLIRNEIHVVDRENFEAHLEKEIRKSI